MKFIDSEYDDLDSLIKKTVETALIKPSLQFGHLVLEVDHSIIGKSAKSWRKRGEVQAVDVAKRLKLSKVQVHFMESGRKQWSTESLKSYLNAVNSCYNDRKKKKKAA
jgi:predicted transcriptional regulator